MTGTHDDRASVRVTRGGTRPCPALSPGRDHGDAFSLVGRLPSQSSADAGRPPLFGSFAGTMHPSDSLAACMSAVRLWAFADRSVAWCLADTGRGSRFSRAECPEMRGVFDCAASRRGSP